MDIKRRIISPINGNFKMKNILFIVMLVFFSSCAKETFFDKFVPEILYFEKDKVENADFKEITLKAGVNKWIVKARVSAPMKLKEIKLFKVAANKEESLLQSYSDFQLSPTVFNLAFLIENISTETIVKIEAIDLNNKTSERNFIIKPAL